MIGDPINRLNPPYWYASPPKTWLSIWIFDLGFVFIGLKWEAIAIFLIFLTIGVLAIFLKNINR
jgi:hypothetical protein